MQTFLKAFEKIIVRTLTLLMASVVLLTTVELAYILIRDVITPPSFLLGIGEVQEIFGAFLLVLIGIELLETIVKTDQPQLVVRVEVVLAVAIIAIARKVIILDFEHLQAGKLLGIAAVVLALSIGYYLLINYKCRSEL